jgi:hypothetical protein
VIQVGQEELGDRRPGIRLGLGRRSHATAGEPIVLGCLISLLRLGRAVGAVVDVAASQDNDRLATGLVMAVGRSADVR